MNALEIQNLSKAYSFVPVLRELTLRVPLGKVYGLLGPHGAGKTTLLHLILGFLKPNEGKIQILGTSDPKAIQGRVGYLAENHAYHARYKVQEYLRFLGKMSDLRGSKLHKRVSEVIELVGLEEAGQQKIATCSKGMLQRLGIAQAMLAEPDLLLLDNPTAHLAPDEKAEIFDLLLRIRPFCPTTLLCMHYSDEVEFLCDRVGVLAGGKIVAETEVRQLRVASVSVKIQVNQLPTELKNQLCYLSSAVQCGNYSVTLQPNNPTLQTLALRAILDAGVTVLALKPLERPLEQFYLQALYEATHDLLRIEHDTLAAVIQTLQQGNPPQKQIAPPHETPD